MRVFFSLLVCLVFAADYTVQAAESSSLAETAFDFAEKYNPRYEAKARQEFDRWLQELSARLSDSVGFAAEITVWGTFLYAEKKIKCGKEKDGYPFFIDDILTSRQGSPLGIAVLWAAMAERLQIPFHVSLSPRLPFMSYGSGTGNSHLDLDNPRQYNELSYFALSSGIPPGDQKQMVDNSSYFRRLSVKQVMALCKQSVAVKMAQAGHREEAKRLLFECKHEFPGVAQISADLGGLFLEDGDVFSARQEFEEAVRFFSHDLQVFRSLSEIAWQSGDLTRAKEYSERVLGINPDDTEALRSVIRIKILREGLRAAEPDILQLTRLRPEDPEAMLFRGLLLYFGGNESAASDVFKKVMGTNGNEADALVIYGLHYFLQGTWGLEGFFWKSMEYFRRAEEINPEHWTARYLIGLVYLYTQQYPRAKETFESLLKKTPNSPDVLLRLARALVELGEFTEAGVRIGKAESLEPNTPSLRFARSLLFFHQARLKEAIREMELAVANAPYLERNLWRLALADICVESNEIDKAAMVVEPVLAEFPQNHRANLLLGRICIERKEWDLAEKRLNVAMQGTRENGEALRLLAKAEFGRGEMEKAWHYIRAAQRAGTHDPELMSELRKISKEPKSKKVEHVVVTK